MPDDFAALFVDCDSYFASVEQHLDPRLRGRPVAVAPVMAETSCCIAASYEAKAFGVKTGTPIHQARRLCPEITIVESKPAEYIRYHHQVIATIEDCIHVEAVLSIDELWARIPNNLRSHDDLQHLCSRIKQSLAREVSPVIRVSIGVGPNRYLAKTASKMRKPNGLQFIQLADLPEILFPLNLRDLNGIARNLETRLHAVGIHTVRDLCLARKETLHHAWGGIMGDRFWHLIRGDDIPDLVSAKKSISHSHVLPPERRTPEQAWPILCKLLHKAAERLRSHHLLTTCLILNLSYLKADRWSPAVPLPATDSTLTLMRWLAKLWRDRPDPKEPLIQVAVTLSHLTQPHQYTPELFPSIIEDPSSPYETTPSPEKLRRFDATVDQLRARYGRDTVYLGSVHSARDQAPMRISFTHIPELTLEQDTPPS